MGSSTGSKPLRTLAGLASIAVSTGGVTALVAAPASATGVTNGPIAISDGVHWNAVNGDGTGKTTVSPTGGGFNAADQIRDVAFSRDGSSLARPSTSSAAPERSAPRSRPTSVDSASPRTG